MEAAIALVTMLCKFALLRCRAIAGEYAAHLLNDQNAGQISVERDESSV